MCFFLKFRKKKDSEQIHESEQDRVFNKALARAGKLTHRDREQQIEWRSKYANEENKGWAILQRQCRLQESQMVPQYKNDERPSDPPAYDDPPMLDKELRQLHIEYKKSQIRLNDLRIGKIYGAITEQFMLRHEHKDENNRSYCWRSKIRSCVDTGGCCSRACGCCEKPLREHLRPVHGGRREVVGVYGHCTAECACCIRHQGFYLPDSRLPKTPFNQDKE